MFRISQSLQNWLFIRSRISVENASRKLSSMRSVPHIPVTFKPPEQNSYLDPSVLDKPYNSEPSEVLFHFESFANVYEQKSSWELARAWFILSMCSINWIADNSFALMTTCQRILPSIAFKAILGPTFYRQFVAGDGLEEIQKTTDQLASAGIQPMVAVSIEDCPNQFSSKSEEKNIFEDNMKTMLECVAITSAVARFEKGTMQIKITALFPIDIIKKLNSILVELSQNDYVAAIEDPGQFVISSLETKNFHPRWTSSDSEAFLEGLGRLDAVARDAAKLGVQLLVDAEYTSQNDAIAFLALALMNKFNKRIPVVWNTYQCYLKASEKQLRRHLDISERLLFCHGSKIVRGAYIEQERDQAAKNGTPSPVWETKEQTDANYDKIVSFLISRASSRLLPDEGRRLIFGDSFVLASHNERSLERGVKEAKARGLPVAWNGGRSGMSFAQLYGMSDHVTLGLAQAGFPVFKSLPYGNIDQVLPYLSRRSSENKSVIQATRKEKLMLKSALKSRFTKLLF